MSSKINKTSEYWGKEAGTWVIGRGIHWTEHPAVQRRLNAKVSGSPEKDAYQFFMDFLIAQGGRIPLERCLTLGCGAGDLERGLAKYPFCRQHDAYDIAGGAIERAKEQARAMGLSHISYEVADINTLSLPPNTYDVVFGVSSVHHLKDLEHVYSEVDVTLKPGGYFFLNEFVGPTKFQWTDKQLNIVNKLLQILPDRYRVSKKDSSSLKSEYRRPTIGEMDNIDPSEAIRSEDILKLLPVFFDVVEKKDLGGTILHLLLQDIAGNFDQNNELDMKLLNILFEFEDIYIETGELPSDFTVVIARKRK
ncbi:MAG: class I SAM-dependent methyltransferase [Nitrospirota bacterium]